MKWGQSEYTDRVLIAVPERWIPHSNHLACWVGEFAEDINTFSLPGHVDAEGVRYAVAFTVVKPVFLASTVTGQLPELPDYARDIVDRVMAREAFHSLSEEGGIRMLVNVTGEEGLALLGLREIAESIERV